MTKQERRSTEDESSAQSRNESATVDAAYRFVLDKPLPAHDGEVRELVFRKPTAGDILRIGNPVIFDPISDPPRLQFDERKMMNMLAVLAGVPPSTIAMLDPRDWISCAWGISPFFIPRPGAI